ncbi:MAG: ribonuclease toxin immunity protein CdiI [Planctomycetaceae bacterium]
MPERLRIDDDPLLPVQAFFNAIDDESFVRVIDALTSGVGYATNECDCLFPSDLDPGEEIFQGVRFSLFEQSNVISPQELARYIKIVSKGFVEQHPAVQENVARILNRL